jgi:hypothetical protein
MPDRIYRLKPGQSLTYDVSFKRRNEDLSAIPSDAPAVHLCPVKIALRSPSELTISLAGGAASRTVPAGDTLLMAYRAIREIAAEAAPEAADDLEGCALVFGLTGWSRAERRGQ